MFIVILLFIILVQTTFTYALISYPNPFVMLFGVVYLAFFVVSLILLIRLFRNRTTTNYKPGFYAFGGVILSAVPSIGFLPFGIAGMISGSYTWTYIGFGLAALMFLATLYGIVRGRWNWKVHTINLFFDDLPEDFDGKRIVQISDVHVGSFFNQYQRVKRAIEQINQLQPDYVFFTGDLVNNQASEMNGWEPVFKAIESKSGKFSILGNHDYGDYIPWENEQIKDKNLEKLIQVHEAIGFKPLLNDAVELDKNVWLLGVENWGKPPFRQSGDLHKTLAKVPEQAFKILLSHDPSHFDEQIKEATDIRLTLSGHTHGMQFGIERFGIKWSPVSLRYKKWAGLYQEGLQYLYVNRGFGYLGFPGRVGIYPEITEIILRRK